MYILKSTFNRSIMPPNYAYIIAKCRGTISSDILGARGFLFRSYPRSTFFFISKKIADIAPVEAKYTRPISIFATDK